MPSEIRTAYNVPSSLTGSGQTIVIIDAYGSPTLQHDFNVFNGAMGLPTQTINVVAPLGQPTPYDGSALRRGWAGETSLDVEWAHAIAPGAQITLVISPTSMSSTMHSTEDYAVQNKLGSVISMSFGANEADIPGLAQNKYLQHADSLYQQAKDANITLIASAGDLGATNGTSVIHPEFPASDPLVLSVGGTSLFMADNGTYQGEKVWNDSDPSQCPFGCKIGLLAAVTGGAPSLLLKTPSYQQMLFHPASRQVADVSYNAGVYTAVLAYHSYDGPSSAGFYFTGGTSAGSPQWAGIIALANQSAGRPLGFVNQALYNIAKNPSTYASSFHDVTSGSNNLFSLPGLPAAPGYDNPTGLGSPNVANLIPALIAASSSN
ncbi:MAG: S53 family peptidase [Candidatus Eremiobacteraeota bacterium]|nr:S53 family peptidase [Candidatus Eremiobacteraeota bacterium]